MNKQNIGTIPTSVVTKSVISVSLGDKNVSVFDTESKFQAKATRGELRKRYMQIEFTLI
jgi:hypothetical protein